MNFPEPLKEAADWIATYRVFWEERLDALEAFLSEQQRGNQPERDSK